MKDYNKKNLKRLGAMFLAALILVFSLWALALGAKFWWASAPTSGAAIACAAWLFYKSYYLPEKEKKVNGTKEDGK